MKSKTYSNFESFKIDHYWVCLFLAKMKILSQTFNNDFL